MSIISKMAELFGYVKKQPDGETYDVECLYGVTDCGHAMEVVTSCCHASAARMLTLEPPTSMCVCNRRVGCPYYKPSEITDAKH